MCTPRYTIRVIDDSNPDRVLYEPLVVWPRRLRRHLNVNFTPNVTTIVFDENGKPTDIKMYTSPEARQKIHTRRETPKSNVHASDE